jgi:hypothetical protein
MAQFRAKARAVDLLGKGQIADLPTAISELWKNGYDAYGDNLEAYLYMKGYKNLNEPIFVLTDDGKGMSREDILEKWFVLGTDSKTRAKLDKKGEETLNKEPRVKMGEKGIGRLAVAYLGPQMLMLTKKINHPLEVVLFDWRILENYELFLSDVNIPLKTIESVTSFHQTFQELKKEFLLNFPEPPKDKTTWKDPWKDQQELKQSIISDCENLSVPQFIVDDIVSGLSATLTKSHATKFIIFKPEQQLVDLRNFTKNDENEDYKDDVSVNHTVSTLIGLFNLFKTENPEHKTHFWINEKSETGKYDLLTFKSFFSPQDFKESDHLIEGEFDEYGEFKGDVRIYKQTVKHTFKPIKKRGKTNYGSFKIKLGYVQQEKDQTLLNDERKRVFEEKLKLFSGLFIYRDGFRVLPYGRPDTDFLEFEERRSKRVGEYFFSKRRMFGYIEITRGENEKLKDKSSREGFINNTAFRDFKIDLIAFFKDLAKKYFSDKAETDYKKDQQEELSKLADVVRQEHERDIEARKDFAKKLTALPKELEVLENHFSGLVKKLEAKSSQSQIVYDEIQSLLSEIEECKVKIADLKLLQPSRFKPTDLQKKNFHKYDIRYQTVVKHFDDSAALLKVVRDKLKVHELFKEFEAQNELYKNRLSNQFGDFESRLETVFEKINAEFSYEKKIFIGDFSEKYKAIIPPNTDVNQIARSMKLLENIFKESQERLSKRVNPYFEHLERLSFEVNEDNLVGYYKAQFEVMKEEWNKTYELAQLGIAVEIIDHQFNTLYSQLAESIKSLKANLQPSTEAENKYKNLDTAFDHLQDNYKLLQPLYRTTGRIRKDITGIELKDYVEEFFKTRLDENKIEFTISPAAEKWTAFSFESIFKPVLINIINNAIYWLQPVDKRKIKIDAIDNRLLIMNSGEPIADYMLVDIFKMFYSNRPKGRGIGLYLAKQSLNGIGYEIEATNESKYNQLNGACFSIFKIEI